MKESDESTANPRLILLLNIYSRFNLFNLLHIFSFDGQATFFENTDQFPIVEYRVNPKYLEPLFKGKHFIVLLQPLVKPITSGHVDILIIIATVVTIEVHTLLIRQHYHHHVVTWCHRLLINLMDYLMNPSLRNDCKESDYNGTRYRNIDACPHPILLECQLLR